MNLSMDIYEKSREGGSCSLPAAQQSIETHWQARAGKTGRSSLWCTFQGQNWALTTSGHSFQNHHPSAELPAAGERGDGNSGYGRRQTTSLLLFLITFSLAAPETARLMIMSLPTERWGSALWWLGSWLQSCWGSSCSWHSSLGCARTQRMHTSIKGQLWLQTQDHAQ